MRKLKKFVKWTLNSFGYDVRKIDPIPLSSHVVLPSTSKKEAERKHGKSGPVAVEKIYELLRSLGVKEGDHLLIHSSLKAFHAGATEEENRGPECSAEEYAAQLIAMFQKLVGENGVLMFPTDFMGDYLIADGKRSVFSLAEAKSNRGFLTEYFRRLPGVKRSTHPVYNCAVWGRGYEEALANHWNYEYVMDDGTPWSQLMKNGGKIVFFGTNLDCNSMIHVPEYMMRGAYPRPVFFERPHEFQIVKEDGTQRPVRAFLHGIRWSAGTVTKFCNYLNDIYGIYQSGKIENATVTVVGAQEQTDALNKELARGISWYDAEYREIRL